MTMGDNAEREWLLGDSKLEQLVLYIYILGRNHIQGWIINTTSEGKRKRGKSSIE